MTQHPFEMLQELLEQDQFELLLQTDSSEDNIYMRQKSFETLRLVYLMNDAAESFLVFHHVTMTGEYDPDYEGELAFSLEREREQYVLALYQGETAVTLFFDRLTLEVHTYDYGKIGHFWVKGYEYLRQLEYKIAIVHDKLTYLGEAYCTAEEIRIASLAAFPPLNYCCYPSVSAKYIVPGMQAWEVTEEAIAYMTELAEEVRDRSMKKALECYQKHSGRCQARRIAAMLRQKRHAKLVDLLAERIAGSAAVYPGRTFDAVTEEKRTKLLEKAHVRSAWWKQKGLESVILYEEPFVAAKDSLDWKVYVMVWKYGILNRYTEIEEIT